MENCSEFVRVSLFIILIVLFSAISPSLYGAQSAEIERLRQEIEDVRNEIVRQSDDLDSRLARLDELESKLNELLAVSTGDANAAAAKAVVKETPAEAQQPMPDTGAQDGDESQLPLTGGDMIDDGFPGSWPLFGTDMRARIGGYIKFDAIYDFDGSGNEDQFLLNQIPVDGSPEANKGAYFHAHVKETRFNLDFRQYTPGEPVKQAFVEVDFFTSPDSTTTARLRHAYAVYENFLIGRSWTTLSEIRALPYLLDFAFGDSLFGGRTEQVRYQRQAGENWKWAIALENPNDDTIVDPSGLGGQSSARLPYLAGRILRELPNGGLITVGGQVQQLRWDGEGLGPSDTAPGWAAIAAGRHQLSDRLLATWTSSYSDGFSDAILALFGTGASGVMTPDGIKTDRAMTFSAGFGYAWSPQWSSDFHIALLDRDTPDATPDDAVETGAIVHINLLWKPTPQVLTGVEFMWGDRENTDGATGTGRRLQYGFRYLFNSP